MAMPLPPSSAERKESFIGSSPPADPAFKPSPCPRATRKVISKAKVRKKTHSWRKKGKRRNGQKRNLLPENNEDLLPIEWV
jgi:hypothetical protein